VLHVFYTHIFFFHSSFLNIGGMYPELITRPDLKVYLPPIGGISVYIFGNPEFVSGKHKNIFYNI
jgi:hypothetical protein